MKFTPGVAIYLVFFLVIAGLATKATNIFGAKSNLVFYWLAAIGVTSAAFWAFLSAKWEKNRQAAAAGGGGGGGGSASSGGSGGGGGASDGEIGHLVRDAETKMMASRIGQGLKLSEQPVIFVLGEKG